MVLKGRDFEFKHDEKIYDVECEYTETLTSYYPATFDEPEEIETDITITLITAYDRDDCERFVCNRKLWEAIEQEIYSFPIDLKELVYDRAEGII